MILVRYNSKKGVEALTLELNKHWRKEKGKNGLFITGKSAAGKTTLATILKEKYNCKVIHLDKFILHGRGDDFILKWYETEGRKHLNTDWYLKDNYKSPMYFDHFVSFFEYALKHINNNTEELYLCEGVQLFYQDTVKYLKQNDIGHTFLYIDIDKVQSLQNVLQRAYVKLNNSTDEEIVEFVKNYLHWNAKNKQNMVDFLSIWG